MRDFDIVGVTFDNPWYATRGLDGLRLIGDDNAFTERCADRRSQHTKAPATLTVLTGDQVHVEFDEAQDAITPGQGAVFYDGPMVLGGGWIDKAS